MASVLCFISHFLDTTSNFWKRVGSSVVLLPVVFVVVVFASNKIFVLSMTIILGVVLLEWLNVNKIYSKISLFTTLLVHGVVFHYLCNIFISKDYLTFMRDYLLNNPTLFETVTNPSMHLISHSYYTYLFLVCILILVGFNWIFYSISAGNDFTLRRMLINIAMGVYFFVGCIYILFLRLWDPIFFLYILALTVAFDVGAYFAGRFWGQIHIMSHISPKKTLEGVLGGIFCALITSICWIGVISYFNVFMFSSHNNWLFVVLLCGFAFVGDMLLSICKRYFNVKNYGRIIPGHGGLLDRLDSLFLVVYFVYFAL